ncbi:MAG: tetratricopeptide repeat protein [Pseudanabaena sp. ELA748]
MILIKNATKTFVTKAIAISTICVASVTSTIAFVPSAFAQYGLGLPKSAGIGGATETMQNCKYIKTEAEVQVATQKYELIAALKIFQDVLIICRELKDIQGESITLNYIGSIYKELRDYPNAIIFYQKALEISNWTLDKIEYKKR